MKIKTMILSCLAGAVVLSMCVYRDSGARSKASRPASKIGVVSVRRILGGCKRVARYRDEAVAERDKVLAGLDKLSREIETDRAGLKTLKAGSSDHLARMKEILEKQASLQARQEFGKQQMALKERRLIEGLYKDILQKTREVAEQKDLDMVLEGGEPELSTLSSNELTLAISTHKLLYSGGCVDITEEVMARVDAGN